MNKKIFLPMFLLTSVLIFGQVLADESSVVAESPSGKSGVTGGQSEFNVRDFRDPFESWLPKAIKKRVIDKWGEIAVIDENDESSDLAYKEEVIPPEFFISGLIWNTDFPQAIINDKVVGIGDVVEDAEILDITKDGIKIQYQGEEFFVTPQLSIVNDFDE
jgi:hypothetical protein